MRVVTILTALLVTTSMAVVAQPVAADDKWADRCKKAEQIDAGSYTGSLTPGDDDVFNIRIPDGESITVSLAWNQEAVDTPGIHITNGDASTTGDSPVQEHSGGGVTSWSLTDKNDDGQVTFTLYGEDSELTCVYLSGSDEGSTNWEMSIARNEATPAEIGSTGQNQNIEQKNQQISELESQIEQKNQRISELESQLEQKNQSIQELESQVQELQSQSSNSDSSGQDVSIQVTVNPADGQENFVRGSKAVVQAESENADVSKMAVQYGSGTYQLDSSGKASIPLAETGEQQMKLVYGETTKQVSIQVRERQTPSGGEAPQQDNEEDQNQVEQSLPDSGGIEDDIGFWGSLGVGTVLLGGALFRMLRS